MSGKNTPMPQDLFQKVADLIEASRKRVATAVNTAMVYTYYEIGRYIVEDEQNGASRAEYGKAVLRNLSQALTDKYGSGWSYPNLKNIKLFYLIYSKRLNSVYPIERNADLDIISPAEKAKQCLPNSTTKRPQFILSWSHYLILMRIENPQARSFYEIECARQQWSVRQLQRQYGSSLFERLALSRDKDEVMRLAEHGQTIEKSQRILSRILSR